MKTNGVYFFSIRDKCFAFNINTTACVELNRLSLSIFPEVLAGNSGGLGEKYSHAYPATQLRECIKECRELLDKRIFVIEPITYRHRIQNNILALTLHISHDCNLNCEYCYAGAGSFGEARMLMSTRTMRKSIDFAFKHIGNSERLNIGFFGGEPLLNLNRIREAVAYAKQQGSKFNKKVSFSMTSNATLLSKDIMEFLSNENFSLIFSIDGPKEIHDRLRKYPSRKGSHSQVLRNIKEYNEHYSKHFTARGTFTRTTPNFTEQVLFLNDQGFRSVSVEPAQLEPSHIHSISRDSEILRVNLEYDRLADVYLERFDEDRPLSFFHFDYDLRKLIRPQPIHTQCGAGAGLIAVIPDGRIFPCFESVVEKENCIGHIESGFDINRRKRFQLLHADAKKECRECWIKYSCGGGCHAFNIRYNNNTKVPYKPNCEFVKYRFKLSAWILSKIKERGKEAIKKLKTHLNIKEREEVLERAGD